MNWQHFQAFVWLRWRLMANQWRRAGTLNALLMTVFLIAALIAVIPLFVGSFVLGTYAIPKATPIQLLYAWDGMVAALLFFWSIGLVTELQRSDPLTLSKFLHLPVSVQGAFLINYLSSLICLSLLVFVPLTLGFALALVYVKGALLLIVLPLLAAFLLMVTSLTYQFQGWLASLMSNPRRRRTVLMAITASFVLIAQLPNLINIYGPWNAHQQAAHSTALVDELKALDRAFRNREFDAQEHLRRQQAAIAKSKLAAQKASGQSAAQWEKSARLLNLAIPAGWLPLGAMTAAEGQVAPAALGVLGMSLIGATSLWRAYRTTFRMYQGQPSNRKSQPSTVVPDEPAADGGKPRSTLLEARLPGLSEPVSAIALGSLRSLLRAPEAKMALLTPLIMSLVFGSMSLNARHTIPESFRPLIALGGMLCVLLGVLQLAGNQFGFDRDGFRVYVLCAAPRRDILLGKNLAFAPVAMGVALLLLTIVQVLCPLRLDHFLAVIPLFLSMFLLACIFTNFLSIYAPIYIAAGSLSPSNPKLTQVLLQLLMFMVMFPLMQLPILLPLGVEAYLEFMGWTKGVPVCLLLSLAELAVVVVIYRFALAWQGRLFQEREQAILETVTNRAP